MKILRIIILVIVTLLSLAAGLAKVMQVPQEAAVAIPKTRNIGAIVTAVIFLISAIMIFMNGQVGFGLFSLLPTALAGSVLLFPAKK